jgi:two-component system, NarL family, nitrate/nitrite response regulator NarL
MYDIALYSTQPVLAAGLRAALAGIPGFDLAPVSTTISQLVDQICAAPPTVVLVELTPEVTLDVLRAIQSQGRGACIVLWVDTVTTEFAAQVIALGVRGILRRTLSLDLHLKCLRKVAEGELWLEKGLSDQLIGATRVTLTHRERQLVGVLAQGLKNKEIAHMMGITEGTVKVYLSRLFRKVGANDRFDLALFALRNFGGTGPGGSSPVVAPSLGADGMLQAAPRFVPGFMSRAAAPDFQLRGVA